MSTSRLARAKLGQAGMASIIVTMIMMIVIILIIVSFAAVVRRNSREALDRQLSAQAYYAAETGVNQAANVLSNTPGELPGDFDTNTIYGSNCSAFMNGVTPKLTGTLSSSNNVAYTCLLVDPKVSTIVKNLALGNQAVYPISLSTSSYLQFTWQANGTSGNFAGGSCPAASTFTPTASWSAACPYGMLRLDIYNGASPAGGATSLSGNTATVYIKPSTSDSNTSLTYGSGVVAFGKCSSATKTCTATIRDQGGAKFNSGTKYWLRMTNIYEDSGNVTISPSPGGATFSGAQYLVDATGRAQDEVQRIQVRISSTSTTPFTANNVLSSGGSICKQFTTEGPGSSADPATLCPAIP